ncbi:MPN527 family putative ECF transporter permease subunit [Mycoplasmopsis agalactiae]|uniref:MPN527 family putative ECF transporter permease subunit n=1 Tax=Mycoplasmopsis agalactiae TaxID=2110 RepID=UPI00031A416D|nr:hypothetical protein [Mycoplasmopsis agalactiae]
MVQSNNKENIYYFKNRSIRLSYTGMMLAIAILVNFAGSKLLSVPFISFLKFDFALVVITATALWIGWKYAFLLILLLFLLGPSYGSHGYSLPSILGHLILSTTQTIYMTIFYWSIKLLQKTKLRKAGLLILPVIISILVTTGLLVILNIYLFTPWYFKLFGLLGAAPATHTSMIEHWGNIKGLFLNISTYYKGAGLVYLVFNLVNLTMNSVFIFIIFSLNSKNNFINKNISYL